ncbi:MAG: hypothetical protein R3B09_09020 [Nannocystaceae bacterium]
MASPRQLPVSDLHPRAVLGLPDFGARAQSFSGVLQSTVERTWDEQTQAAVAKVWFIAKNAGGDAQLAIDLRSDLELLSEEGSIVEAALAARIEDRLDPRPSSWEARSTLPDGRAARIDRVLPPADLREDTRRCRDRARTIAPP